MSAIARAASRPGAIAIESLIEAIVEWAIAALLALFISSSPQSGPIKPGDIHVVDGDTIILAGEREETRLVGYNTPEPDPKYAQCEADLRLGARASTRLKQIVAAGDLTLEIVPCACRPGTEGTSACNHGRACAVLSSKGRNVGDILIAEGLAEPLKCSATRCPPVRRPWCG